uniref:Uncharacterized protein n=1 Tax=Chromera velia CCMP2878 TaxID=1169474 RepID=A0A0G4F3L7_9ALVE|eukprot:Cvel_15069.t1-p1 / transcript=Cvel_15069.t1 / gene=Cvel_15069 / organism=Chromera_velia_CCMP2878 / gene_product=hypothetical protein / transcript_product=hypothetical protein / location=Cvel_scaffold1098:33246-36275(-) / protein_length=180 / sequence_SO=supercontig / SO=protein_coding / is_pseudo=false
MEKLSQERRVTYRQADLEYGIRGLRMSELSDWGSELDKLHIDREVLFLAMYFIDAVLMDMIERGFKEIDMVLAIPVIARAVAASLSTKIISRKDVRKFITVHKAIKDSQKAVHQLLEVWMIELVGFRLLVPSAADFVHGLAFRCLRKTIENDTSTDLYLAEALCRLSLFEFPTGKRQPAC